MIGDSGPAITGCWPLPPYAHRPGQTPRPVESPAFDMASRAPAEFDVDAWANNQAYIYGFVLYHGGFFWEAHEVWEPVWQSCQPNSRERHLLQGLIQLANAELKLRLARPAAAQRLRRIADRHLSEAFAPGTAGDEGERFIGVDVRALRQNLAGELSSDTA